MKKLKGIIVVAALFLTQVMAASCTNIQNKPCSCSCWEKTGEGKEGQKCNCCDCCPGKEADTGIAKAGNASGTTGETETGKQSSDLPGIKDETAVPASVNMAGVDHEPDEESTLPELTVTQKDRRGDQEEKNSPNVRSGKEKQEEETVTPDGTGMEEEIVTPDGTGMEGETGSGEKSGAEEGTGEQNGISAEDDAGAQHDAGMMEQTKALDGTDAEDPGELTSETGPKEARQTVNIHVNTDIITASPGAVPAIQIPDISSGQKYSTMWRSGGTAYEFYFFNQKAADIYAEMVNHTASSLSGMTNVYNIIVPLQEALVLTDEMRQAIEPDWKNEEEALNYYAGLFAENVRNVPLYRTFLEHRNEYLFFRTDHHWTALGAYYAYAQWAKIKGIEPRALSDYGKEVYPGFLGSFYSSCLAEEMRDHPDTVEAFLPEGTNAMTYIGQDGAEIHWKVINDVSTYKAENKYGAFSGGDNPLSYIVNPNLNNGQSCLVVKDSYGNPFIPFLVDHYQYVYWIDYRYYRNNVLDFVRSNGINDLLFVVGISPISDTGEMERMRALFQ